jgi:hypothetical protein
MSGGDESDESDEELTHTNQPPRNSNEIEKKENRKTYRKLFLKLRDDIRNYIKRSPQTSRDDLLNKIFNDRIEHVHHLKDTLRPDIDYDTFIDNLLIGINFEGGGKKRRRKKLSKRSSKKHRSKRYKSQRERKTRRRSKKY